MVNKFDKLCALLTIPLGAFVLVLSVTVSFTGFGLVVAASPLSGLILFILGWSMCVSLGRFWVASNRLDQQRMRNDLSGERFARFLELHPEFIEAEPRLQWKKFRQWTSAVEQAAGNLPQGGQ